MKNDIPGKKAMFSFNIHHLYTLSFQTQQKHEVCPLDERTLCHVVRWKQNKGNQRLNNELSYLGALPYIHRAFPLLLVKR